MEIPIEPILFFLFFFCFVLFVSFLFSLFVFVFVLFLMSSSLFPKKDGEVIYGLNYRARALAAVKGDKERIRFLVGTCSLRDDNEGSFPNLPLFFLSLLTSFFLLFLVHLVEVQKNDTVGFAFCPFLND